MDYSTKCYYCRSWNFKLVDVTISLMLIFIKHFTAEETLCPVSQSVMYSIEAPLQYDTT